MNNKDFIINDNVLIRYLGDEKFVVIPEGVKEIAERAFICNTLYSIVLPMTLEKIALDAFESCDLLVEIYNLSDINIEIGDFDYFGLLETAKVIHKSLYEKSSVIVKDDFVFVEVNGEYELITYNGHERRLVLPDNINGMGYSICATLISYLDIYSLTIPECVTSIETGTFNHFRGYEIYNLSQCDLSFLNVGYRRKKVIHNDINEESIIKHTNDGFLYIENDSINIIDYDGDKKDILIPKEINGKKCYIGNNSFSYNTSISRVVIEEGITDIDEDAFMSCTNLVSVTLPSTLKYIGKDAFVWCRKLFEINNLSSLELDTSDFDSCKIINKTYDQSTIFRYNDYLVGKIMNEYYLLDFFNKDKTITLPDDILGHKYELYNFFDNNYTVESVDFGKSITTIDGYFRNEKNLKSIYIPKNIIQINAHNLPTTLEKIVVDEDNPIYDSRDNSNCIIYTKYNLVVLGSTNAVIPSTVEYIGSLSFSCGDIEKIDIPEGVRSIKGAAFRFCHRLREITLPSTLETIEKEVFHGCPLYNVYYGGTKESWIKLMENTKSLELTKANIYYRHPITKTYIKIPKEIDKEDFIKGYISDIVSEMMKANLKSDNLYDVNGYVLDVCFYSSKIPSTTTMNIKFNDGKKTVVLELYISNDVIEFYKKNIIPGINLRLKGSILWDTYTSPIQFLHDEIEIYDL